MREDEEEEEEFIVSKEMKLHDPSLALVAQSFDAMRDFNLKTGDERKRERQFVR